MKVVQFKWKVLLLLFLLAALSKQIGVDEDIIDKVCTQDSQCAAPYVTCQSGKCTHKAIFPMELQEFLAFLLIFLMSALAVSGGIGGGILLVPIFIIMLNFSTK
jgi:Trk-type K+ transport system membrane component